MRCTQQRMRAFIGVTAIVCAVVSARSEEHTSELQSPCNLVCRLLLEKKYRCRLRYAGRRPRLGCQRFRSRMKGVLPRPTLALLLLAPALGARAVLAPGRRPTRSRSPH